MRANDRRGCADGASRVARRTHGRGSRQTKTRVPSVKRGGAAGGNTMNQSLRLVTEGDVGVAAAVPKRPVESSPNGGRSTRSRLGEESKMTGARAATWTRGLEEGKEVSSEKSKGRELDALLLKADHRGVYKRFLVWGWLAPVCLLVPCAHLNFMLMVYLPPSNCTLPAPPRHVSHDAWRILATPRTSTGELNTCALYDFPSALKDSRYDPGKRHTYSTSNSKDTHTNFQDPRSSTVQPSTSQDTSTSRKDIGTYVNVPSISEEDNDTFKNASQDTNLPEKDTGTHVIIPSTTEKDTGTFKNFPSTSTDASKLEGDTSSLQHTPVTSEHSRTPGEDTSNAKETQSTSEHLSMPQYTPVEGSSTSRNMNDGLKLKQHHPSSPGHASISDTHDPSEPEHPSTTNQQLGTTEQSYSTSAHDATTPADIYTLEKHLTTPDLHISTLDDPRASEQYPSIVGNPLSTPTQDHLTHTTTTTATYPDLSESRAARYFDPFDDLFDLKKKMNRTKPRPKRDPLKDYKEAALMWQKLYPEESPPSNYTIGCVFGHDFDKTYVQETVSTRFEYACGESKGITRILHASMAGNLVGCIVFGALGDKVGRKWVFMVLAVKVALLGTFFVLARGPWALLLLRFLVALGLPAIYQVVLITALEQVRDGERGLVTSLSSVCFSLGQCLLALLAWLTGHWVNLGLATSLPAILALIYLRLVEESPRWLVSRGRAVVAAKVLRRVTARNNNKNQPLPSLSLLRARIRKITSTVPVEEENELSEACRGTCGWLTGSVTFLMAYPYLSFRVMLYTICWTVNLVLYFISTMKYPHVSDNPYIGWFCTSVTEVPANLLVPLFLRYLGRRALHSSGLAVCSAAFFTAGVLLAFGYKENFMGVSGLVLVAKFCSAMTFLVVYLQAAELHPTPIRSFVTGLASLVALTVNIFSPSILAMDNPFHAYLLLGVLGLAGTISAILLPETAGRSLPQTLHEAEKLIWWATTAANTANTNASNTSSCTASNATMTTDAQRDSDRRLPSSFNEMEEEDEDEEEEEEDEDEEPQGVVCSVRSSPYTISRYKREESVL